MLIRTTGFFAVCLVVLFSFLWGCTLQGFECRDEDDCQLLQSCLQGWCRTPTSSEVKVGEDASEAISDSRLSERLQLEHTYEEAHTEFAKNTEQACSSGDTRPCYDGQKELTGRGICKAGKQTCQNGMWSHCQEQVLPKKELCNGSDDDCDGQVDEDCNTCFPTEVKKVFGADKPNEYGRIWKLSESLVVRVLPGKQFAVWDVKLGSEKPVWALPVVGRDQFVALHPLKSQAAFLDKRLEIREVTTGKLLKSSPLPPGTFNSTGIQSGWLKAVWDHKGSSLWVRFGFGKLFRWDLASNKWIQQQFPKKDFPKGQSFNMMAVHPSKDLFALHFQGEIVLWESSTQRIIRRFTIKNPVYEVRALGKSDWWLINEFGTVQLWNGVDGRVKRWTQQFSGRLLPIHKGKEWLNWSRNWHSLAVYQDGSLSRRLLMPICKYTLDVVLLDDTTAITLCTNGQLFRVNLEIGKVSKGFPSVPPQHQDTIKVLAFSSTGKWLASGSQDKSVRLWRVEAEKVSDLKIAFGHEVDHLQFAPNGEKLFVGLQNGELYELEVNAFTKKPRLLAALKSPITGMDLSPTGPLLAVALSDGRLVWREQGSGRLQTVASKGPVIQSLRFSGDGQFLLTGDEKGRTGFWSVTTKVPSARWFNSSTEKITRVLPLPGLPGWLTFDRSHLLRRWHWPSGKLEHVFARTMKTLGIWRQPRSPYVFKLFDRVFRWISLKEGREVHAKAWKESRLLTATFSPDGRWLAVATDLRRILVMGCPKKS